MERAFLSAHSNNHALPSAELFSLAALGDPVAMSHLPRALYDILRRWHTDNLLTASFWSSLSRFDFETPPWDLFGPLPMSHFARDMHLTYGFHAPILDAPIPPLKPPSSWHVAHLLSDLPTRSSSTSEFALSWFAPSDLSHSNSSSILNKTSLFRAVHVNLCWPHLSDAPRWLKLLRTASLVIDPDPDRVAFLRQFGVPAFQHPFPPLPTFHDDGIINHMQLKLGLPDPRWLLDEQLPAFHLSILGSSSHSSDHEWSLIQEKSPYRFLWLPRINSIILSDYHDAIALQSWLSLLDGCTLNVLILEPLHHGLFSFPNRFSRRLDTEDELDCLEFYATADV